MRRTPIDPSRPLSRLAVLLAALVFVGTISTAEARAQAAGKTAAPAPAPSPPMDGATVAGRDKLLLFVEFDGLDAHQDAWRKTAAARMLNDTPLGAMLEEIGVPLLERMSASLPKRMVNGADAVAIIKHVARKGFVLTYSADPSAARGVRGILVLKGVTTSKESKSLFSRLIGSFMDPAVKPKIERKGGAAGDPASKTKSDEAGRVLVSVPPVSGDGKTPDQGWGWWPEKDDLIIGLAQPSDLDVAISRLDGKTANAVGCEPIASLAKPDAGVAPVLKAYFDPSARPGTGDLGFKHIEYRWGFQDEALAAVTRIVAPKPRQGTLSFLDQPPTEAKKLLPIPDGVEYMASVSLKPEQWAAMISTAFSSGSAKAQYDAMVESVKSRGRIDFEKDLIGNLGPRALFYLAPTTSASAVDEPRAGNLSNPMAMFSAVGARMPRPVIVAEVGNPAQFSRALDAVMLEANKQIKAAMAEQIAAAVKAEAAKGSPGGLGGREDGDDAAAAERKERRKEEAATPEFRLLPTTGGETSRTYMLNVSTSSPVKLPPGFKPTVRMEGKIFVVSTSPEAARVAMDAAKQKTWAPSEEIARAISKAPDPAIALLYGDFRDTTSGVLASLPGTLQTTINSAIAASEAMMTAATSGRPGAAPGAGPGSMSRRGGGPMAPAGSEEMRPGGMSSDGMLPPPLGGSAPAGAATAGTAPAMIQLRVDPSHLPKVDELKALMFPSTTTVTVDDDSIRIVSRNAFPDVTAVLGAKGVLPAMLAPAIASARMAAKAAAAAQPAGGQSSQPVGPGAPGAVGAPGAPGPR